MRRGEFVDFYKKDFTDWSFEKEVEYNNSEIRQKSRYEFFQQAYDYLQANFVEGDYYEFGCHKARTFRMSLSEARKKNRKDTNFYAFDSFEGLPDVEGIDKFPGWEKGALKTALDDFNRIIKEHGLYVDKVHAIKGFFQDTLTKKLQDELLKKSKIMLAYIDSDLYESCKCALAFIEPLLQDGSIVCFDDWNNYRAGPDKGERRAFREFQKKTKLGFQEFINVGWFGKSFIVNKK